MVLVYDRFVFAGRQTGADVAHARARAHCGPPCRREPHIYCRLDPTPPPGWPGPASVPALTTQPPLYPPSLGCCGCSVPLVGLDLERRLGRVQAAMLPRRALFLSYEHML